MPKLKTRFVCQQCGAISIKWQGRCPECHEWNSLVEEIETAPSAGFDLLQISASVPQLISQVSYEESSRLHTNLKEFDRVLGGGLVTGSVILIGGVPGIGKSTLLLEVANNLSEKQNKVLYVSGEESLSQIKLRANRLKIDTNNLYLFSEVNLDLIEKYIEELSPKVVIIDSIQTIYSPQLTSPPGGIGQVKDTASRLIRLGKGKSIIILLVGHVTKDGSLAGPRVLEHMVDCVLYFEGENLQQFRILRSIKNRFGSTNEVGIYQMTSAGLKEILDISGFLLNQRPVNSSGSVIIPVVEGTRSLLVELQALVTKTNFQIPARKTTGIDYNRLALILAVLEKRTGFYLSSYDVFINVVGGVEITEPASDLGLAIAIASSLKDKPIDQDTVILGELGLAGEVRTVHRAESRLKEAQKLGFKKCILPKYNITKDFSSSSLELIGVSNLKEALRVAKIA